MVGLAPRNTVEGVAWRLSRWCFNILVEICVHTLPLLTPSVQHSGRDEGRVGGEFFGLDSKVLPGNTLRRGNWSDARYQAIWIVWLFHELDHKIISSGTWGSYTCNDWKHDVGCRSHATRDYSEASLSTVLTAEVWWLWDQTGAAYSAAEYTGARADVRRNVKLAPHLEQASFLIRFNCLEALFATILRWDPKVRLRSSVTPRYTGLGSKFTIWPL